MRASPLREWPPHMVTHKALNHSRKTRACAEIPSSWPGRPRSVSAFRSCAGTASLRPSGRSMRPLLARWQRPFRTGIADGVQVNSVLPGPVMTGRRRSYLEHSAAPAQRDCRGSDGEFPKEAGITLTVSGRGRRAHGFPRVARRALDDGLDFAHGPRRSEVDLT